jgi:hypothetical protein
MEVIKASYNNIFLLCIVENIKGAFHKIIKLITWYILFDASNSNVGLT